jgi:hypothetical protein
MHFGRTSSETFCESSSFWTFHRLSFPTLFEYQNASVTKVEVKFSGLTTSRLTCTLAEELLTCTLGCRNSVSADHR